MLQSVSECLTVPQVLHVCIFKVGGGSMGDYLNLSKDLFCMVFSLLPASLLAFTCNNRIGPVDGEIMKSMMLKTK